MAVGENTFDRGEMECGVMLLCDGVLINGVPPPPATDGVREVGVSGVPNGVLKLLSDGYDSKTRNIKHKSHTSKTQQI